MTNGHDPQRAVGYLQQCLSNDKKPLGLFLGAGCPMAVRTANANQPLIPDIAGITKVVCEEVARDRTCAPFLAAVQEQFQTDCRGEATVEDILSHIRGLRVVAGKAKVRGLSTDDLDQLDQRICELIQGLVDKALPTNDTPYHRVASWMDALGCRMPVEIFTTNYDLLMEQAFEDARVPYFDGFAGGRKPFFDLRAMEEDTLPPRWARLWKLHGSINWYHVPQKGVFRGRAAEADGKRVIHPSHLKYEESRRMPYLAMIDRLRAFLKQPTAALVICGYSFRDEHINEIIVQGLEATPTAVAFALLFEASDKYPQATELARNRRNLNVLAREGGIMGGRCAKWCEKEREAATAERNVWVKWTPVDQSRADGDCGAEFRLGDFAVFGEFLYELVGLRLVPPETNGAQ